MLTGHVLVSVALPVALAKELGLHVVYLTLLHQGLGHVEARSVSILS